MRWRPWGPLSCLGAMLTYASGHATANGLDPRLEAVFAAAPAGHSVALWVQLAGKGAASKARLPASLVSERCIRRRSKVLPPDRLVG